MCKNTVLGVAGRFRAYLLAAAMSYPPLVCTASAGTDPCALVTEAEVATALGAPVETVPPHHVRRNGDLVGGDCFYRSRAQSQDGVTISVDEYPRVDRKANLGRQCSRHESILIPGLGDIACAFESPVGLVRVLFLQDDTLVSVNLQRQQGEDRLAAARTLAESAASRLGTEAVLWKQQSNADARSPAKTEPAIVPRWGAAKKQAHVGAPERSLPGMGPSVQQAAPVSVSDLTGAWLLTMPGGRALAGLTIERDQDYIIELTRGGKTARGRIELDGDIMRMIPEQGQTQELKLRAVGRGAFELTDQKGEKTMMRRTFR